MLSIRRGTPRTTARERAESDPPVLHDAPSSRPRRLAPTRARARALAIAALLVAGCQDAAGPQDAPAAATTRLLTGVPDGWQFFGGTTAAYAMELDSTVVRTGGWSAKVRSTAQHTGTEFYSVAQSLSAAPWHGQRARLRGWIRTVAMTPPGARLVVRVDGVSTTSSLAFDNMADRGVSGSTEWRQVEIVVDVPPDAVSIVAGPLVTGQGQAWYDDLTLDVVGRDVPVTAATPVMPAPDSAARAAALEAAARLPRALVSPGFEPRPPVEQAAVAWLRSAASPLTGASPTLARGDLAAFTAAVGSARLVGLGEGTHGTREHFQLKHRFVEHLVRDLGFTAFAIEASMPEAEAIDRWVRGGAGDPAVLLSNLYFWTWNTEEVLALLQWMRAYNATVPAARQVRFFGFDMQFPGAAIDSVVAYARRTDQGLAASLDTAYACLASSRNNGERAGAVRYANVPAGDRARCAATVARVHADLAARRDALVAASGADAHMMALQAARLVVQWEDMAGRGGDASGSLARDRYMAENTEWLLQRLPAGARMALWAHNYHVSARPGTQGAHLRARFGRDYVVVGFSFGTGSLTAVRQSGSTLSGIATLQTTYVAPQSWEAHAQAAGVPYFLLDARRIPAAADARVLAGPLPMRSIGATFDVARPEAFYGSAVLPGDFDVLVHVAQATASRPLPFRYR